MSLNLQKGKQKDKLRSCGVMKHWSRLGRVEAGMCQEQFRWS